MMSLTAAQHSQIAAAYERAAEDQTLPPQSRAGFAEKAEWFRMLAQVGAAKEAAVGEGDHKETCTKAPQEPAICVGFLVDAFKRRGPVSPTQNS
jgi:hypothetical protein